MEWNQLKEITDRLDKQNKLLDDILDELRRPDKRDRDSLAWEEEKRARRRAEVKELDAQPRPWEQMSKRDNGW